MREVSLPSGERVPALGMGTWRMGEDRARRAEEIATLQRGLELGMTLIDTAEMYGGGEAERLVAEAIRGRRDGVFLVSKVYPHHAGRRSAQEACESSLRRLGVDQLDLYLLHWRGDIPLAETLDAFERLKALGRIRHWGVSNLDREDMEELCGLPGGTGAATDQVLYNPLRRGVEWDLLPWCRERGVPVMAYSPVEQARLLAHRGFRDLAERRGWTPAQLALAWILREEGMIAIPKAATRAHLEENRGALDLGLDATVLEAMDRLFPPPTQTEPLEML